MATWQKMTVGDIGDQRQVWYDYETGNMSETDPNAAAAPTEQDRVNQSIQSIISQHSDPQQQIAAIMANPEHGYRGVLQAINMGWVPNLPGVGEMIAAGQAGDDRGAIGGLGNLFEGGNLLNTLADPGGVVKAAEGGIDNLQSGNYLDPMGVADSFGGDSEVQPVDYLGMGRAADTDWLPVGRMYGRMMAAVGAGAAMSGAGAEGSPSAASGGTTEGLAPAAGGGYDQFGNAYTQLGTSGGGGGTIESLMSAAPAGTAAPEVANSGMDFGGEGVGWDSASMGGVAGSAGLAGAGVTGASALSSAAGGGSSSFSGDGGGGSGGSGSATGGGGMGGGSWLTGDDEWLRMLMRGAPGLLGALGSASQAEDFEDLANQYSNMGAPYRSRLQELYGNPQAFLNSPEVRVPIQQGTDMLARSLSVKGNPAGSGNALQELQNYTSNQLFSRLGQEKDRLGGFGGLTQYNQAAPQMAQSALAAQGNIYGDLGGAAADIFNPPRRYNLQDLMRSMG